MKSAINTLHLSKQYRAFREPPRRALDDVCLEVEEGSITALIGENGAGKSTLVKILVGLVHPSSGSATVLGASPAAPLARQSVGYLPEQMRIHGYFTAASFLWSMGRLKGIDDDSLRKQIPESIEMAGLAGVSKPVREYSKGMQQRLGLAQALLGEPRLLFLDEPTDGLDPGGRKDVRDVLVELRKKGKTIFLNSHLLSEVEALCDRIFLLHKGRVVCASTPEEFAKGDGEYLLRTSNLDARVALAMEDLIVVPRWEGNTLFFKSSDEGSVNQLVDELRRIPVTINGLIRNANGQWQLSVVDVNDVIREVAAKTLAEGQVEPNAIRFRPRDVLHLNAVIDRLRGLGVNIEAIEPVRISLEQFFLQALARKEN